MPLTRLTTIGRRFQIASVAFGESFWTMTPAHRCRSGSSGASVPGGTDLVELALLLALREAPG
jgi:hypothetical protein